MRGEDHQGRLGRKGRVNDRNFCKEREQTTLQGGCAGGGKTRRGIGYTLTGIDVVHRIRGMS